MASTVLSVASRAVLEACEALGLSSDALLAEVGLERERVFDPDARLLAERADAIWLAAYRSAGDPLLALRAAAALPFGAYRVLDFVVAQSPTVRDALTRASRYFALVDQRALLALKENETEPARLIFSSALGPLPAEAQEYTFAALVTRLRACASVAIPLTAVEFTFARPSSTELHEEIFACPLRFGASRASLVISPETLEIAIPGADPALSAVLVAHAEHLVSELPGPSSDFSSDLRSVLVEELRAGDTSMAHVARRLGMSERTLGRRLQEHSRSFADELSAVRERVAYQYLAQTDISLSEVAFLLGFSEQSAFSRAFKRWTGETPGAYRRRVDAE